MPRRKRIRRNQKGGALQVKVDAFGDMRVEKDGTGKKKKKKEKEGKRDISGKIVGPNDRVRVDLAHPDRKIAVPPPGPANAAQNTGIRQMHAVPVDIYAMPTRALPHYKRALYRNRSANLSAVRSKYRTKFDGHYVSKENTSQYRKRDKIQPLDPVQRIR